MARSATAPARRLKGGGKVLNLLLSAVLVLGLMPALPLGGVLSRLWRRLRIA